MIDSINSKIFISKNTLGKNTKIISRLKYERKLYFNRSNRSKN
jgi:hypothetical protein